MSSCLRLEKERPLTQFSEKMARSFDGRRPETANIRLSFFFVVTGKGIWSFQRFESVQFTAYSLSKGIFPIPTQSKLPTNAARNAHAYGQH